MTDSVLETTESALDTRGTLEVRGRAVERIAEAATAAVEGVETVPGSLTTRRLPQVRATVTNGRARVTVSAATSWPNPIAHVAKRIRAAVTADVARHGGLAVESVDVDLQYRAPERAEASTRRVQ